MTLMAPIGSKRELYIRNFYAASVLKENPKFLPGFFYQLDELLKTVQFPVELEKKLQLLRRTCLILTKRVWWQKALTVFTRDASQILLEIEDYLNDDDTPEIDTKFDPQKYIGFIQNKIINSLAERYPDAEAKLIKIIEMADTQKVDFLMYLDIAVYDRLKEKQPDINTSFDPFSSILTPEEKPFLGALAPVFFKSTANRKVFLTELLSQYASFNLFNQLTAQALIDEQGFDVNECKSTATLPRISGKSEIHVMTGAIFANNELLYKFLLSNKARLDLNEPDGTTPAGYLFALGRETFIRHAVKNKHALGTKADVRNHVLVATAGVDLRAMRVQTIRGPRSRSHSDMLFRLHQDGVLDIKAMTVLPNGRINRQLLTAVLDNDDLSLFKLFPIDQFNDNLVLHTARSDGKRCLLHLLKIHPRPYTPATVINGKSILAMAIVDGPQEKLMPLFEAYSDDLLGLGFVTEEGQNILHLAVSNPLPASDVLEKTVDARPELLVKRDDNGSLPFDLVSSDSFYELRRLPAWADYNASDVAQHVAHVLEASANEHNIPGRLMRSDYVPTFSESSLLFAGDFINTASRWPAKNPQIIFAIVVASMMGIAILSFWQKQQLQKKIADEKAGIEKQKRTDEAAQSKIKNDLQTLNALFTPEALRICQLTGKWEHKKTATHLQCHYVWSIADQFERAQNLYQRCMPDHARFVGEGSELMLKVGGDLLIDQAQVAAQKTQLKKMAGIKKILQKLHISCFDVKGKLDSVNALTGQFKWCLKDAEASRLSLEEKRYVCEEWKTVWTAIFSSLKIIETDGAVYVIGRIDDLDSDRVARLKASYNHSNHSVAKLNRLLTKGPDETLPEAASGAGAALESERGTAIPWMLKFQGQWQQMTREALMWVPTKIAGVDIKGRCEQLVRLYGPGLLGRLEVVSFSSDKAHVVFYPESIDHLYDAEVIQDQNIVHYLSEIERVYGIVGTAFETILKPSDPDSSISDPEVSDGKLVFHYQPTTTKLHEIYKLKDRFCGPGFECLRVVVSEDGTEDAEFRPLIEISIPITSLSEISSNYLRWRNPTEVTLLQSPGLFFDAQFLNVFEDKSALRRQIKTTFEEIRNAVKPGGKFEGHKSFDRLYQYLCGNQDYVASLDKLIVDERVKAQLRLVSDVVKGLEKKRMPAHMRATVTEKKAFKRLERQRRKRVIKERMIASRVREHNPELDEAEIRRYVQYEMFKRTMSDEVTPAVAAPPVERFAPTTKKNLEDIVVNFTKVTMALRSDYLPKIRQACDLLTNKTQSEFARRAVLLSLQLLLCQSFELLGSDRHLYLPMCYNARLYLAKELTCLDGRPEFTGSQKQKTQEQLIKMANIVNELVNALLKAPKGRPVKYKDIRLACREQTDALEGAFTHKVRSDELRYLSYAAEAVEHEFDAAQSLAVELAGHVGYEPCLRDKAIGMLNVYMCDAHKKNPSIATWNATELLRVRNSALHPRLGRERRAAKAVPAVLGLRACSVAGAAASAGAGAALAV